MHVAAAVMVVTMVATGPAAAAAKGDPNRKPILDLARIPVEQQLGRPVRFVVNRLNYAGDHAFLLADMQDVHGRPVDYRGTRFAREAEEGVISKSYAALLKRDGRGGWTLIAFEIGPTDEVWTTWPSEYGVPAALFR